MSSTGVAQVAAAANSSPSIDDSKRVWDEHPRNPYNWTSKRKWTLLMISAIVTMTVGLNATSITTPSKIIAEHFHVSDEGFTNSFWPVTTWNTGAALGPMVGLPLLENFGVRNGYLLCYTIFALMVIPQAVATDFATLLVCRAIAGAFGGILQNAMETIIADIWRTDDGRNLPITIYTFSYVAGVTLGPALGALVRHLLWRWVFYIQIILYFVLLIPVFILLKETRSHVVLRICARRDHTLDEKALTTDRLSISKLFFEAIRRPILLLFSEPIVFFLTLWAAFSFGLVFIMTQSVAQVYSVTYNFSDSASGLVQIGILVGEIIGFMACMPQNRYYQSTAKHNRIEPGNPIPEARLPLSIPASLLGLAGGLFWYGWTSFPRLHWILPTIGIGFVGFGIMVIVTAVDLYITDAYQTFAGSAIAAVALGENLFAAWLPLSTEPMYRVLGFQWASSLLGFVALALTLAPIVLFLKGDLVRSHSKFAKTASSM